MHLAVVQRIVGLLLMLFSITMWPPMLVSIIYQDGGFLPFLYGFLIILLLGAAIWFPARNNERDLRLHHGFLIVVSFWTFLGLSGSIPLLFASYPDMSVTDAVFESLSGLTTTGATVISNLGHEDMPKSILFYRQQLQWLGGMGIIVLAVAILPMLGIGGMQLYRAETPGPMKESKLTPRITETAKTLWLIYVGLTIACGIAYSIAGMDLFDAVSHAFSTVAIGGFSPHDSSIGHFNSSAIEIVCIAFMFISGINFALHFMAFRTLSLRPIWKDPEFRGYISILAVSCCIVVVGLTVASTMSNGEALLKGVFQVISFGTTTGFTTSSDYTNWPLGLGVLLIMLSFVGGCAGSTGGGMKVVRVLLIYKQGMREIMRLIHPNGAFSVKLGSKVVSRRVVESVWGFFSVYVAIFAVMMLFLMATGLDNVSAYSAVAAALNNLGPGLGEVSTNFSGVSDSGKWVLVFAMLLGRLEIFSLLVILMPAFWRR